MKSRIARSLSALFFALLVLLNARAEGSAMDWYWTATIEMGDLRTPLSEEALGLGAAAIARAKSIGGATERECELIDAVSEFYKQSAQSHDERLVHYERALSRSRRLLPEEPEISRLHAYASRIALARARERVEAKYALNGGAAGAKKLSRISYVASVGGPTFAAFKEGLRDAGYVEGKDVVVEARFTEGRMELFPAMVAELLASRVDVLVAGSPPGATAAIRAETTTPIVIAGVSDPAGLAKSLGRPAAHITGTSLPTESLGGQWLEMLTEIAPGTTRVAVLLNPSHPSRERWQRDIRASASARNVDVAFHEAGDAAGLERALAAVESGDAQGLVVTGDPVYLIHREKVIALAARRRLPAVYFSKIFADAGGLFAYGGSLEDSYRRAPAYIDRILKGAKPADLAIEAARLELVLNRKTAAALGITLPASLVARADKVIE